MPFLDFITNRYKRQLVPERTQLQKTQTAKEMYTRRAAEEQAGYKPVTALPSSELANLNALKARLEKATQHHESNVHPPSVAPAEGTESREALRQNAAAQDRSAPALSPTSMELGKTALQPTASVASSPDVRPAKAAPKPLGRAPQTVPRRAPSWER